MGLGFTSEAWSAHSSRLGGNGAMRTILAITILFCVFGQISDAYAYAPAGAPEH